MTTVVDQLNAPHSTLNFNTVGGDQHNHYTYITNADNSGPVTGSSSGPVPSFNDAPLSVHFIGRRRELELIARAFARDGSDIPHVCVLFGDQGVGKSQLTYEWSRSTFTRKDNKYVMWMPATTVEKVDQGFSKILHLINHADRFRSEQTVRLTVARRWLENVASNWLLVLDNVFPETLDFLRDHLPRHNGRGSILFTTRTRDVALALASIAGNQHKIIEIPRLSVDEGVELFLGQFGEDEVDIPFASLEGIVKEVGCLPLAISHTAAFMKQSGNTAEEMLGLYRSKYKIDVISWQHSLSHYEHKSITATFLNQLEDLESKHPDAANLMKMLAYFDPEKIPLDMLVISATAVLAAQEASRPRSPTLVPSKPPSIVHRTMDKIFRRGKGKGKGRADEIDSPPFVPAETTSLLTIVQSPIGLRNALTELQARCLTAYQDSSRSTLRIHDLIQLVVLEKMKHSGTDVQWFECATELACHSFKQIDDPGSPACWPECEALIPHIQSLTIRQDISSKAKAELLDANSQYAWYMRSHGRYREAEQLLVQLLADEEHLFGSEDQRTLDTMHRLAVVYDERGHYVDAETLLKRVLQSAEKLFGPEHLNTLKTMYSLASVYYSQRRFAESEELIEKVLKAREKQLGSEHIETLKTKNMLAGVYYRQKRYREAETLYKEVLESTEKLFGPDHIESAWTMNNLALVYLDQGRHSDAERLFKRVLRIKEKHLGSNHPSTLTSKDNLAFLYKSQGRYDDAEELFVYVLGLKEEVLGPSHPDTRHTVDELASMYENLGRLDDAAKIRRRADELH